MGNSTTVVGKYIFLDIVGYSYKRTVEAQTDIIAVMNRIVNDSLKSFEIKDKNRILIPTGDGMCIAVLDMTNPFDVHIQLALRILETLDKYNRSQKDEMRKFQVRIGINENTDNMIIDINGNKNVAGAGITEAQRIMDQANAGNILVGRTVYNHLKQRDKYVQNFKEFEVFIKHYQKLEIYQYLDPTISYLNSEEIKPSMLLKMIGSKKKALGDKIFKDNFIASMINNKKESKK